jgi:protein-tyrosine-phosphatase
MERERGDLEEGTNPSVVLRVKEDLKRRVGEEVSHRHMEQTETDKCSRQYALDAESHAKYHFDQQEISQYSVVIVLARNEMKEVNAEKREQNGEIIVSERQSATSETDTHHDLKRSLHTHQLHQTMRQRSSSLK